MATIYEVSKMAGVSLATVSRVINNKPKVSDRTRERVRSAMEELGYRPNSIAQSLASKRSKSIGVLISELNGPFYGPMMTSIETAFRAHNIHVVFAAGHSKESTEKDGINFLLSRNVDALILYVEAVSDDFLVDLNNSGTPVILIGREVPSLEAQSITLDNFTGSKSAVEHLLTRGHRQIAYVSGPMWKQDAQARYDGYLKAHDDATVLVNDKLFLEGDFQPQCGYDSVMKLLDSHEKFTAVVCANDEMASGAMRALYEKKIRIPEDIALIGFDNVVHSQFLSPALTTVNYPVERLARSAAKLLLSRLYDVSTGPVVISFTPELLIRESA